jgi:apolipoprotein N-acyltransferase
LIVPSFDAASWSATQHLQHGALFRLRAAENGRWLACAASSGVSQVIDPHGNTRASLPVMEQGVVAGHLELRGARTLFTRYGWFLPWLACVAAAALMVWTGGKEWRAWRAGRAASRAAFMAADRGAGNPDQTCGP